MLIYSSPSFPPLDLGLRPKLVGNKEAAIRTVSFRAQVFVRVTAALLGRGGGCAGREMRGARGCAQHPPLHGPPRNPWPSIEWAYERPPCAGKQSVPREPP